MKIVFRLIKDNICRTNKTFICKICDVEITESKIRRYRTGVIKLFSPVVHIWYFKNIPSYLAILLNEKVYNLEKIIYFDAGIRTNKPILSIKEEWGYYRWYYNATHKEKNVEKENKEKLIFGGEAIQELLKKIKLKKILEEIKTNIKILNKKSLKLGKNNLNITNNRKKQIRRLRLINNFIKDKNKPEWMIIQCLPVLPPDLRPIMITEGGVRYVTKFLYKKYNLYFNKTGKF
jgi:DNA-directed RNA polymerase subunit beta'